MQRNLMYNLQQDMQRKTINFTGSTAAAVEPFLTEGSTSQEALTDLVGEHLGSESEVLRALVRVGIRAVRDHQLELGYVQLAATRDKEDDEWLEASMRSAAQRWNDEL